MRGQKEVSSDQLIFSPFNSCFDRSTRVLDFKRAWTENFFLNFSTWTFQLNLWWNNRDDRNDRNDRNDHALTFVSRFHHPNFYDYFPRATAPFYVNIEDELCLHSTHRRLAYLQTSCGGTLHIYWPLAVGRRKWLSSSLPSCSCPDMGGWKIFRDLRGQYHQDWAWNKIGIAYYIDTIHLLYIYLT